MTREYMTTVGFMYKFEGASVAMALIPHSQDSMKLVMYYEHTPEWWGQAIWFYNKMNKVDLPQDIFEVVEAGGSMKAIPDDYLLYTKLILDYWSENHRLAEMVLPRR